MLIAWVRGILGGGLIAAGAWLAATSDRPLGWFAVLAFYLVVSRFANPRPDRSNVGWAGGLIDNPFRWSDDKNRILLLLQVLLLPGRLSVAGVRDLVTRLRDRPAPPKLREKNVVWERRE